MIAKLKTAYNSLRGSLSGASRAHYRKRGLDTNRARGDRPYRDLSDEKVKREHFKATTRVRDAPRAGVHLSPTIDRSWMLQQEWEERGNDPSVLIEDLRDAGYEVDNEKIE